MTSPVANLGTITTWSSPQGTKTTPRAATRSTPIATTPVGAATSVGHASGDTQARSADGTPSRTPADISTVPKASSPGYGTLQIAAQVLDDLEQVRIAQENRLRSLTATGPDSDGAIRGLGYAETDPEVLAIAATVAGLATLEHQSTLQLQRILRKHPLGAWVKATTGIGLKQGARLLASIGDPYWNNLHNRPRTVSQLWAYAGYHVLTSGQSTRGAQLTTAAGALSPTSHIVIGAQQTDADGGASSGHPDQIMSDAQTRTVGVAAKRRKGVKSNWSGDAKMRAYLCAEACIKVLRCPKQDSAKWVKHPEVCTCSPYRVTYDERRMHTDITHPKWSNGHSHNDGLRIAAKAILRDLWIAARDLHATDVRQ
jgi:hypothetical protein